MVDHCCLTSIRFKNTSDGKITLTVTDDTGATATHEFGKKGNEATARYGPRDAPVPGGLGQCVTISISTPTRPAETWRLCCDDDGLAKGMALRHEHPGAAGGTVEVFHPADVVDYVIISPCPDETAGTGDSATGEPASGIKPMDKVAHDGHVRWGAACRLRYTTKKCKKLGFVQGKKRTTRVKRPGAKDFTDLLPPDGDWRLDIEKGAASPLYPYTNAVPDGLQMTDTPGVDDPWGEIAIDDKKRHLPKGAVLLVIWQFKTWVICMDSRPYTILGHFEWSVRVEITVGDDKNDTTGTAQPSNPEWKDAPDKADYNHVVSQTPSGDGSRFAVP